MHRTRIRHLRSALSCSARSIAIELVTLIFVAACMVMAAQTVVAQNMIPPTARQAMQMPQFAAKLGPRAQYHSVPRATYKYPNRRSPDGWLPADTVIYSNGPINGTSDAWAINFGFAVSDTFTIGQNMSITGMTFGAWMFPGDVLQSVEVLIGTSEFGGTIADQVVTLTQSGCSGNQYGFDVCLVSGNLQASLDLQSGTYWITLQNATVNTGDPVYWDENSGPSMASENSIGTIPSEAFSILGGVTTTTITCGPPLREKPATETEAVSAPKSPTQTFRIIHDFAGGANGASPQAGLAVDAAGNIYGTTSSGGTNGAGTAFKLSPDGTDWRFTRLYSFSGPDGAGPNSKLAIARDGTLYGVTLAGGLGQGTVFRMSPSGHISPTAFSNWIERMSYGFTGGLDGRQPQGDVFLDDFGNVYGAASLGGAYGDGIVYELTNQGLQVLHAFGSIEYDGSVPNGVARGGDGLYGITRYGGPYEGGTVYTLAGGYQILQYFNPYLVFEGRPLSITGDNAGNIYGTTNFIQLISCTPGGGLVFRLSYPDREFQCGIL